MQWMESDVSDGSSRRAGYKPPIAWIVLLALLCQLLGSQLHLHAAATDDNECVSCLLVIDAPAPPGPDQLTVVPATARHLYHAWRQPRLPLFAVTIFLPPPSHAPPAAL